MFDDFDVQYSIQYSIQLSRFLRNHFELYHLPWLLYARSALFAFIYIHLTNRVYCLRFRTRGGPMSPFDARLATPASWQANLRDLLGNWPLSWKAVAFLAVGHGK